MNTIGSRNGTQAGRSTAASAKTSIRGGKKVGKKFVRWSCKLRFKWFVIKLCTKDLRLNLGYNFIQKLPTYIYFKFVFSSCEILL